MPKKRKCRYTPEELRVHEEAVRLRKMTDAQLIEAFNKTKQNIPTDCSQNTAESEKSSTLTNDTSAINQLLQALSEGKCKGIKSKTAFKIEELAKELGLIA